jgi:hypothetical protein
LNKKAILAIIPLIAVMFIATYNDNAFSEEIDLECQAGEVTVVRTTNPNPICVNEDTANKWVEYGLATIVAGASSDEVEETPAEESIDEVPAEESVEGEEPLQNQSG